MNAALPVPVSFLLVEHKGEEPVTPFDATLHTIPITVTAVLEKTLVYEIGTDEWPKREQARPSDVLVDSLALSWRPKRETSAGPRQWRRLPGGADKRTPAEKAKAEARNEALVADSRRNAEAHLAADLARDKKRVEAAAAERRAQQPEATRTSIPAESGLLFPWPYLDLELIKRCHQCTFIRPREGFAKNRTSKDGLQTQCRECMKVYWTPKVAPTVAAPAWLTAEVVWWPQLDEEAIKKFLYSAQAPGLPAGPKIIRTEKRCPRCNQVKPIGEFHRHPTKADGRQSWCKTCKKPAAAGTTPLVDQLRAGLEAIVAENIELRRRTEQLEGILRHLAEHIQEQLAR